MSESTFAVATGFIQFDPKEREVNGATVREVVIRTAGTQKQVYITVWPEHGGTPLARGDFIAAEIGSPSAFPSLLQAS